MGPGSARWDRFFATALAPDPADRPACARELLTDFEVALAA
jgi:hypothetical protein